MDGDTQDKHWTLDRRVSVGHLWTIAGALVMSIAWGISLQFQLAAIDKSHSTDTAVLRDALVHLQQEHDRDMTRMERTDSLQYSEIIRRLELLQVQFNEYNRNGDK